MRAATSTAIAGAVGVGASGQVTASEGIVDEVGRLQVQDGQVCAEDGSEVTLGGMSFFWSNWSGQYYTADTVDYLVDEFEVDLVRAACGVGEEGGYGHDPHGERAKVETVVDQAIERGVYVIIDWHLEGDAWPHHDDAEQFFTEMAQKYGDYPNVIYEPWNEPTDQSASDIQEFCQSIADTIREYDSDNLIICGSSTWSQNPQSYSIDDPNAAYTFHAYPDAEYGDAHMSSFYDNVPAAMEQGNAVFVTEFGAQYGTNDQTQEFVEQCQDWNISMAAWSVNDKEEPWSIFTNGRNGLTEIGQYYREMCRNWPEPDLGDTGPTCGGVEVEETATVDGQKVCDIDGDDNYRDVNADGSVSNGDITDFFGNQHAPAWDERADLFDFDGDDDVGQGDVVELFHYVNS